MGEVPHPREESAVGVTVALAAGATKQVRSSRQRAPMLRPYALVSAAAAMSPSVTAVGRRYSEAMRSATSGLGHR
jgi:hypothetical protein